MLVTISDLILLLLFARIVQGTENRFYFNPVLSAPHALLDRVFAFFRPVFGSLHERIVASVIFLLLVVFRGAIYARTGVPHIFIGGNCLFSFPPSWYAGPACSLLGFAVFLTRFWGFCFLLSFLSSCTSHTRVYQAIVEFGKPFTALPKYMTPVALLAANIALVALVSYSAEGTFTATLESNSGMFVSRKVPISVALQSGSPLQSITVLSIFALFSAADLFLFARNALLVAIFASLIAVILRRQGLAMMFYEFQSVILGYFSRKSLRLGMFDFTPVLFFISLQLVYAAFVVFLLPYLLSLTGVLQDVPPVF